MSKLLFSFIVICVLMFVTDADAQKPAQLKKLDSAQLKAAMKMHREDMMKEKGLRGTNGQPIVIPAAENSQKKTTAANQRLTTNGVNLIEAEVSIAYDPNDSNKLVASYIEQSSSGMICPVYYSSNGGQTWGRSNFNTFAVLSSDYGGGLLQGGGDPVFAWDKNGKLYMAWIYSVINAAHDTSFFNLYWAYSTDDGKNWSVEPGVNHFIGRGASDPSNSQNTFANYEGTTDREWLAVDNSGGTNQGDLYCSFLYEPGNGNQNMFGTGVKVKRANNNFFSPVVLVYNGFTQFANVEVDRNGKVHVTFADIGNDVAMYASSTNGGSTFSNPQVVGTGINMWGQVGFMHDRENSANSLAIADDNSLHYVWGEFDNNATVYYSYSNDGGSTWSPQVDLRTKYGVANAVMGTVAAGSGVSISFYGIDNNDSTSYYQLNSYNNGGTLGTANKISLKPTYFPYYFSAGYTFFGDYNRSVRTGCIDYSAWSDGRSNAGPKIYFAKTSYCGLGVKEITAVNSEVKLLNVYPNPATNFINLEIESPSQEPMTITITDITGKKLQEKMYMVNSGTQYLQMPLENIPSGNSLLSLSNEKGLIATRIIAVK